MTATLALSALSTPVCTLTIPLLQLALPGIWHPSKGRTETEHLCVSCPLAVQVVSTLVILFPRGSYMLAGATFGAIAAYLSAPFIVQSWGWPAVFTVYGLIGFIWVVMWSMLVSERPTHRQVSLLQDKEPNEATLRIPYRAFATYLPLWAIIIVETSHGEHSQHIGLSLNAVTFTTEGG